MRPLVSTVLLLGLLLLPHATAPAARQAATGALHGKVTLTERRAPALSTSAYGRRDVAPRPSDAEPEIRNVLVYLTGVKAPAVVPQVRARISQRDEQFRPRLTAVTAGSSVDFPNEDPFFHNVFSLSRAATFDLGRYRSGQSRAWTMRKPGVVKVFCHLHSQMNATIMVLDHPWFAVPSDDGSFTIPDIPAGEHTVVAWHERIGERREKLRVPPGGSVTISFTLPVLEPSR
jgi:plastocyanin